MNVREICDRGYYDKVTINFVTEPMYGDDIEIFGDMTFDGSVNNDSNLIDTGIFKVRINILGVSTIQKKVITPDELDLDRKRKATLYKVGINKEKSYLLAYADLIVVKDGERLDYGIDDRFENANDKKTLVNTAITLQDKNNNSNITNNVVIVDKVYVYERYRSCGISRWIHENIRSIMGTYMNIHVGDILLIPGDFSMEARTKFGMSDEQYIDMLRKHYLSVGYKQMRNGLMINKALVPVKSESIGGEEIIEKSKTLVSAIKDFIAELVHKS